MHFEGIILGGGVVKILSISIKNKNTEPQFNFTGSYKKKSVCLNTFYVFGIMNVCYSFNALVLHHQPIEVFKFHPLLATLIHKGPL